MRPILHDPFSKPKLRQIRNCNLQSPTESASTTQASQQKISNSRTTSRTSKYYNLKDAIANRLVVIGERYPRRKRVRKRESIRIASLRDVCADPPLAGDALRRKSQRKSIAAHLEILTRIELRLAVFFSSVSLITGTSSMFTIVPENFIMCRFGMDLWENNWPSGFALGYIYALSGHIPYLLIKNVLTQDGQHPIKEGHPCSGHLQGK